MPDLTADQRRALELLAGYSRACTEALMLAHGFSRVLLAELILAGYAAAATEHMMAGGRSIEVRRFKITDAGRTALGSG